MNLIFILLAFATPVSIIAFLIYRAKLAKKYARPLEQNENTSNIQGSKPSVFYKVVILIMGVIIVIFIFNPDFFTSSRLGYFKPIESKEIQEWVKKNLESDVILLSETVDNNDDEILLKKGQTIIVSLNGNESAITSDGRLKIEVATGSLEYYTVGSNESRTIKYILFRESEDNLMDIINKHGEAKTYHTIEEITHQLEHTEGTPILDIINKKASLETSLKIIEDFFVENISERTSQEFVYNIPRTILIPAGQKVIISDANNSKLALLNNPQNDVELTVLQNARAITDKNDTAKFVYIECSAIKISGVKHFVSEILTKNKGDISSTITDRRASIKSSHHLMTVE